MKKILAGLLLILSATCTRGQKQEKVAWKSYSDAKEQVSIQYPASWERRDAENTTFLFMAPYLHSGQKFRENVNLVTGPAEDLYLIEYLADARKKMSESLDGFKEIRSLYIKLNKRECCKMVYEFKYKGLLFKNILYLFLNNGKAYSLTCSSITEDYDQFYPIFEKIARSFRIK